ncbi:hypothetical protein EJ03DRAFT_265432 [Teratosphaeria nubilosa]|uniref:Cell wall mannoprotein PIR1-like C-terminal domain-containing protein n=1 Tax=Teratosphaeria nubilosa TaxID=161662 RepID=A0A6G1LJJ0_9PEZI|nr:hypothetical protein EJ03DRAFT_265432 [Teratosphaeria nubilosa]
MPQGVTTATTPQPTNPAGCSSSSSSNFEITVVNATSTPSKRDIALEVTLSITLPNGVLTDDQGRTGYIASNNQFQFDDPPPTDAMCTAGWSLCSDSTIALGGSADFYKCLSGTFSDLYDDSTNAQCNLTSITVAGSRLSLMTESCGARKTPATACNPFHHRGHLAS